MAAPRALLLALRQGPLAARRWASGVSGAADVAANDGKAAFLAAAAKDPSTRLVSDAADKFETLAELLGKRTRELKAAGLTVQQRKQLRRAVAKNDRGLL